MDCYHGTHKSAAQALLNGAVDVNKGGGELGKGFYGGELLWVAKTWAANRNGLNSAVVRWAISDDDYFGLEPHVLTRTEALAHRSSIKASGATRTHQFNRNVVWSPIVGSTRVDADQHKFEGQVSQDLLNGAKVSRGLV